MPYAVSWQVELAIKPGKRDAFRALTREMVESTKGEEGVLIYERFMSDDGSTAYVYERYVNSASAVSHLLAFNKQFGERFVELVDRKRFTVFGVPSDELKRLLDTFNADYHKPLDGFCANGTSQG